MLGRLPRLVMAAPLAAALAVSLAASDAARPDGTGGDAPALRSISTRLDGAVSTVLIEASEPVAYLTSQPDPLTVLVDLRNVAAPGAFDKVAVSPVAPVSGVDVEAARAPDGSPVARVRVSLDRAAGHRVRSSRNLILVEVDRASKAPKALQALEAPSAPRALKAPEAPSAPQAPKAPSSRATQLRSVRILPSPAGYAVSLSGNGRLVASSVDEAKDLPPRVLLDFAGVEKGAAPTVTPVGQGDIERVRVAVNSREPLVTRVVIDLARRLPYTVQTIGEELRVLFARAAETAATIVAPAATAPEAQQQPPPALPAAPTPAPSAPPQAAQQPLVAPSAPAPAAPPAQAEAAPQARFSGHPVTLDFQGADLRAVLRTFAEISGLNVVIDPSINGTVDVALKEVPWDQALDIILKANKLGYSVDGTIVRIVPLNVLAQENEDRRKLAETEALAGELRVLTRMLSYAKAQDLVPIITKSALSTRGDVQIDARTNTLIIRDLAERLAAAGELISALDKPQPQVEIEARIVVTTREYAQALGVQWGFSGRVDPALGTSTGLAFPNSGSVTGRTGGAQGPGTTATGVNLPITDATSAIGLAMGSINGALNLDVALTALERNGKGRLLSTPRVSTQNNVEAEITQGTQIPIQTVSNNTVTVTFKDATLTLKVTPQITASNTVIMRISVENAQANFGRQVNGIPPIDTQRALTTVLVADGDTTVIGGIYEATENSTQERVPLLHRIPLLGWLFRQDNIDNQSRELLIFITPRIIK